MTPLRCSPCWPSKGRTRSGPDRPHPGTARGKALGDHSRALPGREGERQRRRSFQASAIAIRCMSGRSAGSAAQPRSRPTAARAAPSRYRRACRTWWRGLRSVTGRTADTGTVPAGSGAPTGQSATPGTIQDFRLQAHPLVRNYGDPCEHRAPRPAAPHHPAHRGRAGARRRTRPSPGQRPGSDHHLPSPPPHRRGDDGQSRDPQSVLPAARPRRHRGTAVQHSRHHLPARH